MFTKLGYLFKKYEVSEKVHSEAEVELSEAKEPVIGFDCCEESPCGVQCLIKKEEIHPNFFSLHFLLTVNFYCFPTNYFRKEPVSLLNDF